MNPTLEDKLLKIVDKVEASSLSDDERAEFYGEMALGFQEMAGPILIKFMPKDKLADLTADDSKVTVEAYIQLMEEVANNEKAIAEFSRIADEMVVAFNKALTTAGVV